MSLKCYIIDYDELHTLKLKRWCRFHDLDFAVVSEEPLKFQESKDYLEAARHKADTIFLVSPNTSKQRITRISQASSGFLYLVAVFGTTGVKTGIKRYTINAIKEIKKQTKQKIPVGVGFGVSTPEDVKKYIKAGADAVIVGSAFLKLIEKTPHAKLESKIASFTQSLKKQTKI